MSHSSQCGHKIPGFIRCLVARNGNVADCGPRNLETHNYYDNTMCPDCREKRAREYREYATGFRDDPDIFRNKTQKLMAGKHGSMNANAQLAGATARDLATTGADGPILNFANTRLVDGTAGDLATTDAEGTGLSFANAIEQNNEPTPEQIATAVAAANAMMSEDDRAAAGQQTASAKIITSIEHPPDSALPTPSGLPSPTAPIAP